MSKLTSLSTGRICSLFHQTTLSLNSFLTQVLESKSNWEIPERRWMSLQWGLMFLQASIHSGWPEVEDCVWAVHLLHQCHHAPPCYRPQHQDDCICEGELACWLIYICKSTLLLLVHLGQSSVDDVMCYNQGKKWSTGRTTVGRSSSCPGFHFCPPFPFQLHIWG